MHLPLLFGFLGLLALMLLLDVRGAVLPCLLPLRPLPLFVLGLGVGSPSRLAFSSLAGVRIARRRRSTPSVDMRNRFCCGTRSVLVTRFSSMKCTGRSERRPSSRRKCLRRHGGSSLPAMGGGPGGGMALIGLTSRTASGGAAQGSVIPPGSTDDVVAAGLLPPRPLAGALSLRGHHRRERSLGVRRIRRHLPVLISGEFMVTNRNGIDY